MSISEMNSLYFSMYLEETKEQIEKIEQDLLAIEQGTANHETINNIFRMAHSIKGASAAMGYESMAAVSHELESLLSKVRSQEACVNEYIMDIFLKSIDGLKRLHSCISKEKLCKQQCDSPCDFDYKALIKELESATEQNDNATTNCYTKIVSPKNPEPVDESQLEMTPEENEICTNVSDKMSIYKVIVVLAPNTKMKAVKGFLVVNNLLGISDILKTDPEDFDATEELIPDKFTILIATNRDYESIYKNINSISEIQDIYIKMVRESKEEQQKIPENVKIVESSTKREEISTVRVDITKIDTLLNLVGEFIIDKENLSQISLELKRKYKDDPTVSKLMNLLPHIDFIGTELQETVMSTRMLPLENIFNRFPRMVRDLAKRCNKNINFVVEGKNTEIDRGIIEELIDPLTHILRNAIDHGIETEKEREANGKSGLATLKLSAKHQESNVVIEIEDDGKGIDHAKIRKKVVEKGLATEEDLNILSEKEVIQYIFEPGLSTAQEISEISGRGVGLDVVKSNIGKLNGLVDVKTQLGTGTRFTIKLPLTLAIIQALLVKEGEYIFALPISSIIETIRLQGQEINEKINRVGKNEIFKWRDQGITVVRLSNYFDVKRETNRDKLFVVVIGFAERKYAIIVEGLIGEQEIVIKSMGEFLGRGKLLGDIKGISGVSILGDGKFAQVIDLGNLI